MSGFHNIRLPDSVEQGAQGGPKFHTTVVDLSSGAEQRNLDWAQARAEWDIGFGVNSQADYEQVRSFFYARRGQGYGFRFKDWSDFELDAEPIGTGDGANKVFQIIKSYEPGGPAPYLRRITRPVIGDSQAINDSFTIYTPANTVKVYLDGALQGSGYTLGSDANSGLITFAAAPAAAVVVTVSCEFDMPVRFSSDKFTLQLEWIDAGVIASQPIIEIRE